MCIRDSVILHGFIFNHVIPAEYTADVLLYFPAGFFLNHQDINLQWFAGQIILRIEPQVVPVLSKFNLQHGKERRMPLKLPFIHSLLLPL